MKISVGIRRNGNTYHYPESAVFILGIIMMCALIIVNMSSTENDAFSSEAVYVMGSADREEVFIPEDKSASAEEEWSIYDYIGEFFAELIFGER